jgi:sigma-B regulation protein RsbU (phosphoserine phosphatase)
MVSGTDKPQIRVLMIDDDQVDRRAVCRALGTAYQVTEAENGREARQSFDSTPPDCVLLDYNIPGTDTLELLSSLQEHVPVVMLTGQNDIGAAVAAMKAGAEDYLSKNDFTAERLDRAIQRSIVKAVRRRRESEARDRLRTGYRSEKRRRRELEASLRVASEIQQGLLPSGPPQIDGFDFSGVCRPLEETAGDFFDYFPMCDGSLALVVGDVCGHGIGPALLTAETRAYLRALTRANADVGQVATLVNQLLWDDMSGARFLTLFFGRLDPVERTLIYASAGHPAAHIAHASGRITALNSQTAPLGMFEKLVVPTSAPIQLSKDDVLFVATDGLFDVRASDGTLLGRDLCVQWLLEHRTESTERIVDELLEATRRFSEGALLHDDLTIVVAKAK